MIHRHGPVLMLVTALLCAACGPAPQPPAASRPRVDVVELGATQARGLMAEGKLTSRDLTQAYLDRIAAVDDAGPALNAVIELNPRALADAAALDAERKAGTAPWPAARSASPDQGQHRRRRPGQFRRLPRDGGDTARNRMPSS